MKTPEEIGRMSPEQLEAESAAQDARVPQDLERRIMETLAADEIASAVPARRPFRQTLWLSLSAVAAAAALFLIFRSATPGRPLRDTYDDPYLAYAEVEKTFQTISDKLSTGTKLVRQAQETAGKPREILDKTQSR